MVSSLSHITTGEFQMNSSYSRNYSITACAVILACDTPFCFSIFVFVENNIIQKPSSVYYCQQKTPRVGMGWYRYQIFDTIDTGLRSDGINTCKQYQSVSIHARAALRMRKVYVSTLSRENQWCHLVVTAVVTGSSSPLNMFLDMFTCSWTRTLE